ncbi:MAG: 50S ribosomal protein L44e [Candidatus Micrarchaeota archaeon]
MKFPKEVRVYCPSCKKHGAHKVKVLSKGKARTMSAGTLAHDRSLSGHGGKRAGKKTVKKQGKTQRVMLECLSCKKKHEKIIKGRTVKKLELKA